MPKERVVVFDGEDKFILPRNVVYNKFTGEAQMIGEKDLEVVPPQPIVSSGEKRVFDEYMRRQTQVAVMPSPVEPDFCNRMNQFIISNGNGLATPEQIMQAYTLFQDKCVEKPEEKAPVLDTPTPPSQTQQPAEPEPIKTVEPTTPIISAPFVPLSVPTLGQRPMGGGAARGGGEEAQQPARKPNLLIWLVVGGVVLYFLTRKSN